MLTIGIPTYNDQVTALVANVWEQCTVLNIPFEIIVVDDASTDAEILFANKKALERSYCKYLQHTKNKGRTASRSHIAQVAAYDWLLFMDADVLPKHSNLIKNYVATAKNEVDAVFGGIVYEAQPPQPDELLRWKYGCAREQVNAQQRDKTPYVSVVSACFMIRKELFLRTNPSDANGYGLDIRFAQRLSEENVKVQHIDNPVLHLGLESNALFLSKTKNGIQTLATLTKNQQIPANYKSLQRFYLKLKRFGLLSGFLFFMEQQQQRIEKNLTSTNPSLFWFDMFRVYEYAKQMKDA